MHVTAILGPLHFALRQLNTVVCSFHHRLAQGMLFFLLPNYILQFTDDRFAQGH